MHDIIVVGGGLIGGAATRHLSRMGRDVALIAPEEPADRQRHAGVFASHYDEGRITRILDPDEAWATTAARSIARYPEIEAESGVRFFTPTGFLYFCDAENGRLADYDAAGTAQGARFDRLDTDALRQRFPYLIFPDGTAGLHEHETAGYVSPRRLAAAQTEAARRHGATVVRAPAIRVSAGGRGVEVETEQGTLRGDRALVAAGGFTNAWGLVPKPLDLTVYGRTVVLIRVSGDALSTLAGMPSLVGAGAYLLPPIRYPDGQTYVKIGVGTDEDARLETAEDLDRWFKSDGSAKDRSAFLEIVASLIPSLRGIDAIRTDTCVTSYSPHGLPMIDWVDDDRRIAVAVAGNGKGAKSSDDWGYAAALLISGGDWDHPVARDRLKATFR